MTIVDSNKVAKAVLWHGINARNTLALANSLEILTDVLLDLTNLEYGEYVKQTQEQEEAVRIKLNEYQ